MSERNRRLVHLTRYLQEYPLKTISLTDLTVRLGVAKSTISEDLLLIKDIFEQERWGRVETIVGAQGGIVYIPHVGPARVKKALADWALKLRDPARLTADGFLYLTDLLFDPQGLSVMAYLLSEKFREEKPQFVATVETKGIPLAMECARQLGITVVLLRRDNRISEGSALSINYLSGSSQRIQSMSLARRSPVRGSRVLFIDDFMQAGGTARAAADLLGEFEAQVVGVGILVSTEEPKRKLIRDFSSCFTWAKGDGIEPVVTPAIGEDDSRNDNI